MVIEFFFLYLLYLIYLINFQSLGR